MNHELAKQQKCICMRNGIDIWLDAERADNLAKLIVNKQFIEYEGRILNRADFMGVFLPEDLEGRQRQKMGQHKCQYGIWHDKTEMCGCWKMTDEELEEEINKIKQKYAKP